MSAYDRDLKMPPAPPNRHVWGGHAGGQEGNNGDDKTRQDINPPLAAVPVPGSSAEATTNVLIPVPVSLKKRMDATYKHTMGFTGFESKREFNKAAFALLCEHLEGKYNNGDPFPVPGS